MGRPKLNLIERICKVCEINMNIDMFRNGRKTCKSCANKQQIEYRKTNIEKVRKIKKAWRLKNRDTENYRSKKWKVNLSSEQKEEQSIKRNKYLKNKRKTDPNFVMKEAMHRMLKRTLKFKTDRTSKLLGYSKIELKEHIESLFIDGMSWENRDEWHIDHKRPISSFPVGTPPNVINALDNLQPLWWQDNLSKGDYWE